MIEHDINDEQNNEPKNKQTEINSIKNSLD